MHPLIHLPDPSLPQLLRSLFQAGWCPHTGTDTCRTGLSGHYFGIVLTRFHRHPVCGPVNSLHGNSCAWSPMQPGSLQFSGISGLLGRHLYIHCTFLEELQCVSLAALLFAHPLGPKDSENFVCWASQFKLKGNLNILLRNRWVLCVHQKKRMA